MVARDRVTATSGGGKELAVVARVDFGGCVLLLDDGEVLPATVRARFMGPKKSLGNAVVVGDRAIFERLDSADGENRGAVCDIEPRRNAFARRAPGRHPAEQVVAANLDQVLVVTSFEDPAFSPGFADRVLCQAEHAGIPARLVLNKTDLAQATAARRDRVDTILADYARAGCPGHAVSAKSGDGIEALHQACRGRRSLCVGHSGVGKSTLMNALIPGLDLLVGRVNEKTRKGRHTTTAALLLRPEPDLDLIDTPGVRVFGLWGVGVRDLDQAYLDFRPYLGSCRFADCAHDREPGCAVQAAAEAGLVSPRRLASFLKLREELRAEEAGELPRDTGRR